MTGVATTGFLPARRARDWRRLHRAALALTDSAALMGGVVLALLVAPAGAAALPLSLVWSMASCVVWWVCLAVAGSRDPRIVGTGTEFARVLRGTSWAAGLVAVAGWLVVRDDTRFALLLTGLFGTAMILMARLVWQRVLLEARRAGRCAERVLVVGDAGAVERVVHDLARDPAHRMAVVDTFVLPPADALTGGNVVLDVLAALRRTHAETVLVTTSEVLCPDAVRRLGWALWDRGVDLAVAPPLREVASHRVRQRNIAGRPVLHLQAHERRSTEAVKRVIDIVASTLLLVALAPVLLVVAAIVAATSRGPVLFRQERIGRAGRPFQMLKFRSMRVGADAELAALLTARGAADQPLFKVQDDPRVTRVGRVLRRYSLDELPQLLNVLGGSMSLVGPRPQRAAEVALYDDDAHRRLLVRPGMSGLWQVEGRSALPWDEAIRLDLYYVDNRSIRGDLQILFRTARAVAVPGEDEAH